MTTVKDRWQIEKRGCVVRLTMGIMSTRWLKVLETKALSAHTKEMKERKMLDGDKHIVCVCKGRKDSSAVLVGRGGQSQRCDHRGKCS